MEKGSAQTEKPDVDKEDAYPEGDETDNNELHVNSANLTLADDASIAKDPEEVDEFSEDDLHELNIDEVTAK